MHQVVGVEIHDGVEFEYVREHENRVSIAWLEAMHPSTTIRSLDLSFLQSEGQHLTAIVDPLLENDATQSLCICADSAITCSTADIRAEFLRIMDRNMCLQELEVRCVGSVQDDDSADDDPHWEVDLGAPIAAAISRNR